jgi:alkanesulfonate monooxygenase SsuD/methylene tetrahydromethanopterin reductase-like flavin-dependent oxidoreductase (luciferase family)
MAAGDPRARDYGPDRRNRLVTDERAELIRELRRLAAAHGLRPAVRAYRADGLVITPRPVVHTSHPPYLIGASGT